MDEKDLYSAIVFDVLAMMVATLLATVNVLTFIFMVASIILMLQLFNDIRKYKASKYYNKNKFVFLISLSVVAVIALALLISVVATKNIVFTYCVYAIGGIDLLVSCVVYTKEYLNEKKIKQSLATKPQRDNKPDFVVKEMGTSKDRMQSVDDTSNEVDNINTITNSSEITDTNDIDITNCNNVENDVNVSKSDN